MADSFSGISLTGISPLVEAVTTVYKEYDDQNQSEEYSQQRQRGTTYLDDLLSKDLSDWDIVSDTECSYFPGALSLEMEIYVDRTRACYEDQ